MTGCRIGKIKPKNGGAEISLLQPRQGNAVIHQFISNLSKQVDDKGIQAMATIVIYGDGSTGSGWSNVKPDQRAALIGACEIMKSDIIKGALE